MKSIKYQRTKRRKGKASKLLGHARSSEKEILICDDVFCNDHLSWKEHITLKQIEYVLLQIDDAANELMQRIQKFDNAYTLLCIEQVVLISDTLENMKTWAGECMICACLELLCEATFVVMAALKMKKMEHWYSLTLRVIQSWGEDAQRVETSVDDFVEKSKLDN